MISEAIVQVECYSGHSYAEQPMAFYWQGQRLEVASLEATWYGPDGKHFRLRTTADQRFDLCYSEAEDRWFIAQA